MLIKTIIFDLDQTLTNTGHIHFEAFNKALIDFNPNFQISKEEDLKYLGSKTTKEKLAIIANIKNIPSELFEDILKLKKIYTQKIINKLNCNDIISMNNINLIKNLKSLGFKVCLASNTNKEFIDQILFKTKLEFDYILSNSDILYPKPHPEIYLKIFLETHSAPHECIIVEDSITGQQAALQSGAHLFPVENPNDLNENNLLKFINTLTYKSIPWHSQKIHIVIPMAGEGSRFKDAGFTIPKPLIDIHGLPMVAAVIKDLNIKCKFTFIIKKEHDEQYNLTTMLKLIVPNCQIRYVTGKQEGAATTILQIKNDINTDDEHLIIVNSDQMWDWKSNIFYYYITQSNIDGCIVVFEDKLRDPKWSFAKINNNGYVIEVAEKKPISNYATAGIYAFNKSSDFVKYAEKMVAANIRVNSEFYVCPVYNELIKDGKKITTFSIDKFWPTGTPEELKFYLNNRLEHYV